MKEIRNRNKIGLIPIFHIKAFVSTKLYRQLTSLMMSIVISTVTVLGNTTVALADKKDDVINRIIEQYENGDISRDEAKRALIRNGVTNSPIIDLNEDEDGNEIATDSDLVKKLGEKDRLIDEKIRKIIEDNRDDDTSVVFAWHHEDADSIIDELSDVATKSELKKSEADDNQESKKSVGIYYDNFNKTNKSSETADSETESENIEEAVDTEDDAAVDEESVSEGEVSDENQASEEMMEDDSLDEENEDSNSVDEDEVFENDSQDNESEDFDSAEEDEVSENDSQDDENETIESVEENEGFENNSQDEEAEVSESVNPYEFFMNQFQNEETEVSDSVEEDEVSEDDSQNEEDEEEDSDSVEEDEVLGNDSQDEEDVKEEENSDSVETAEADENESEDEEKKENSNIIKVDKFFEIDSYVKNEDSDSENSEEETTEAETEAAKAIGIMAHSDKNAIAQTAEDAEAEVDADADTDAEIEAETETKAAKAIGILAHSEKTATAQREETTEAAEEEKDYDVIDLSEYVTVSSAVKKFHEEWIESESFDSGNKIGLTLYFSIPEDVMYDKDTRVAAYSMPEGLTSQFEGKGKVISGDETVGTYKLKKNEIEITFDTAFVNSGKSIEGALFFKGRVENNTDEDCLTIDLGGTAGSLDVYKEITKTVVSEDGKVTITATYSTSTFSSNVALHADSIDNETKTEVEEAFNEKLEEESLVVTNMYTYDVYFLDENGEKIEPDGHVSVKLAFNTPIESVDNEELKVFHVKNNNLSDIEDLTPMDDTVINENSKGEVNNVELVTDSFSLLSVIQTSKQKSIHAALTDMTITGATQSSDGNWTVKNKVPYEMKLTFEDKATGNIPVDGDTWMYFEIPNGLYIDNTTDTFDVVINNAYTISGNHFAVDKYARRIYFKWNSNDDNFYLLQQSAKIKLTALLEGCIYQKSTSITFPNGVERTITLDKSHDLYINKQGYYDSNDKLVHYTITVTSTGVSENVKVTDEISGSLLHLNTDSIKISSSKGTVVSSFKEKNDKRFTLLIPKMQDGETINITYTAGFTNIPDDAKANVYTTGNTAKVEADDDPPRNTEPVTIEISSLSKNWSYDHPDGSKDTDTYFKYTIYANSERIANISYITDTIAEHSRDHLTYSGDGINVYVNGSNEALFIPWENLEKKSANGKVYSWTWNIPTDSTFTNQYGSNASFRIEYNAKVDRSDITESVKVKNSVETNHHDPVSSTADITPVVNKTSDAYSKEAVFYDNEKVVWTLSFEVPENGCDYCVVEDFLPYHSYTPGLYDSLFEDQEIVITGLSGDEDYSISGEEVTHNDSQQTDLNNKLNWDLTAYRLIFTFYKDEAKTQTGLRNTGSKRTITITYASKIDEKWLERGFEDANYVIHKNTAYFKINQDVKDRSAEVKLRKTTLKKTGSFWVDSNNPAYNPTLVDGYYILSYNIVFAGLMGTYPDGLTFTDTYDKNLTFVTGLGPDQYNFKNGYIYSGNVYWQGTEVGEAVITADEKNHTLTISIPEIPRDSNGNYYDYYKIPYYLKIKKEDAIALTLSSENSSKGSLTFHNEVKWDDASSDSDVTYTYQALDKSVEENKKTGLVDYTIIVNSNKETLNDGNFMELIDEFDDNQIIDISTIEITAKGADGVEKKNQKTGIEYHLDESNKKLTFSKIPDKTEIKIKYSAVPIMKGKTKTVTLTNKASLLWSKDEATQDVKFEGSVWAQGTLLSLKVVKYKEGNESIHLKGAVFDLYKVNTEKTGEEIKDKAGNTVWITPMTDNSKNKIKFTTNEKGAANISLADNKNVTEGFKYDQLYCLVESQAPKGYSISKDNVYFFAFADPDEEDYSYDETNPLYPNGYILNISNHETTGTELPITGGIGVNLIYLIGSLMITLGGFILIIMRKRIDL